jgi:hypothetical protein
MRLTPPTNFTFFISMLLAALAVVGQFVSMVSNYVPLSMFWVAIVAYIVLWLGNLLRGPVSSPGSYLLTQTLHEGPRGACA